MIIAKHQIIQEAALAFLIVFIGLQYKVACFLHPNSRPDETYLGFTYEATKFTPAQEYDYIIVGGGTAGCPLAATLSEKYSVLLLERGGVANLDPNILYETNFLIPLVTANDKDSPAQTFVSEDGVQNARGRVLGGSSMINFGFYSRADDYFYNNSGVDWDTSAVESAYEWVEDSIVTLPNRLSRWQNSTLNALLQSGVNPANGVTVDHLQGTKVSGSTFDDSGRRHGAVELLNKANRKNLKVVVHATVDRIIFATSNSSGIAATGVIYHDSKGRYHEVHVRTNGEVILSAGALGSPQLLLLSGVGPASNLSSLNIPVVRDNPFIGEFMADNPRTGVCLLVPVTLVDLGMRVVGITESGAYIESPAVTGRLPIPVSFLPLNVSVVGIAAKVSKPLSTGSLQLISATNVSISPSVRFNYYSQTEDILQCVNAVEALRNFLDTPAMDEYKFREITGGKEFSYIGPPIPKNQTDVDSITTFCRATVSTFWHYHGGCLVNKVIDSQFKVIGVDSLRVVDGSTFTDSPGTNPQATVMMLGRYAGVEILNERAGNKLFSYM